MSHKHQATMKWLVIALIVLGVSLVTGMGLLSFAMYSLLGVLIGSRFLANRWAKSIKAVRTCDRTVAEIGDMVTVSLALENDGRLPIAWVLVEDMLPRKALFFDPPDLGVQGKRMAIFMLGPRRRKTLFYQMRCNRRGYYQVGPLVVETGDLFGLHRKFSIATEPIFLLVYPKIIQLDGYEISSRRPIGEVRMTHRLYEDPTRIAGVREYQAGDAMNRVNWRASARSMTLQSKVYEPSSIAGATVVVDFHRSAYDKPNEPVRSDLAVTAAASVANTVYEMGQQIGLVTNGRDAADRIRVEGYRMPAATRGSAQRRAAMREESDRLRPIVVGTGRGPEKIRRILETLARVELTDGLSFAQLLLETASQLPRDATVIAVLRHTTPEHVVALDDLQRRGFAVAVILNVFETYDFAEAAGPFVAAGIAVHHLRDETAVATICRRMAAVGCRM